MPRTKGTQKAEDRWNQGKGIPYEVKPICVKFPPAIDQVLRRMENRSDRIRNWVTDKMREEGLID